MNGSVDHRSADTQELMLTELQVYRRLLDLLSESGLSKAEKLQLLERAVAFVHEDAAVRAIWEPKPTKRSRKEDRGAT